MVKTTTTLYYVINRKYIEYYKKKDTRFFNKITVYGDKMDDINQIIAMEEPYNTIINQYIFNYNTLDNPISDARFKKIFMSRFLWRQMNAQTLELFNTRLSSLFVQYAEFLNLLYSNYEAIFNGQSTNEMTTATREALSNLPQNEINVDVSDDVLTSASSNNVQNQKNNSFSGKFLSPSELRQLHKIEEEIYTIFDKKLFLQIW